MLALSLYKCILLLFIVLPGQFDSYPVGSFLLNDFIQKVNQETPVQTLLIMKRQRNLDCLDINPMEIPTVRHDHLFEMSIKVSFNSKALALVCMAELADSLLLATLAQNLNQMRETRIIVLLNTVESSLKELLHLISQQANASNFINLIVLYENKESFVGYRLLPFPSPTFVRIANVNDVPIYPKVWLNFNGKVAVINPDLFPPRSLLATDRRTGEEKLFGASDVMIREFANKFNIQLRLLRPLSELVKTKFIETFNLTISGQIDIPTRPAVHSLLRIEGVEFTAFAGYTKFFIIVPCGQEMSIGDVYKVLKTYSTIVVGSYFLFAIIETLIVAAINWIFHRRAFLPYSNLLLNLRAFAGVLGLPMPLIGYRASLSLQQIVMVMSIFSLVFTCFFNANLSTLLTKHPEYKQIRNFEELRASGLQVLFDGSMETDIQNELGRKKLNQLLPNAKVVTTKEQLDLLLTLNSSYAYQSYQYLWEILDNYQKSHRQNVLCKFSGMAITGDIPMGYILKKDSIFRQALKDFILLTNSFGFDQHWSRKAGHKMIESILRHMNQRFPANNPELTPLNVEDLNWLWKLLGLCYTVATLVLIGEICVAYWLKKRAKSGIIISV